MTIRGATITINEQSIVLTTEGGIEVEFLPKMDEQGNWILKGEEIYKKDTPPTTD